MKLDLHNPFFRGMSFKKGRFCEYTVEFEHEGAKGYFKTNIDFETGEHECTLLRVKGVRKKVLKEAIASEENKIEAFLEFLPLILKGREDCFAYLHKKLTKMKKKN